MSSLRCVRCYEGLITSTNPTATRNPQKQMKQMDSAWECNSCKHQYRPNLIATTVSLARCLLNDTDRSDVRAMEALLRRLLRTFPPQHFVILELKQTLVAAYRDMILREPNTSRKILNRKIELCRDMLPVLQVVEPGISRLTGMYLITFPYVSPPHAFEHGHKRMNLIYPLDQAIFGSAPRHFHSALAYMVLKNCSF